MTVTLATPLSEIMLSPGSAMTIAGLSWQHYQLLLAELGDNRATRLAYSDGVLEIRMPGQLHESINRLLSKIIFALAEGFEQEIVDMGSTTWNRSDLDQGIEPDSCFFIQHADQVQGLNPEIPAGLAPDLAIEVDIASASDKKLSIYQRLGVPEVWVYRQGKINLWDLREAQRRQVENSLAFPTIAAVQLQSWIALRETGTDLTVVRAVRQQCHP